MNKKLEKWKFGINNNNLIELVLSGQKTATTSLYFSYINNKEPLPKVGDKSIILYDNDEEACTIEIEKVIITEFKNITPEIAYLEGEGDKSLEYYKNVHNYFFKSIYPEFNENSKVVIEIFKVI